MTSPRTKGDALTNGFADRVHANQNALTSNLKPHYDFIVCGSGSSGSVVARRLAENPAVSVLLVEAGGPTNIGSDLDWNFQGRPNSRLNGRALHLSMGKVLGGGSSINAMAYSRGHKNDWDFFAAEVDDSSWNYESVVAIYRRIEDWQGVPDPTRRGTGGWLFVQPAPDPNPIAPALVAGAHSIGIPSFDDQNGRMMEGPGGASMANLRIRDGRRLSIFRSYVYPYMDRPNLTVLTKALVTRLIFQGKQATGVEIAYAGKVHRVGAGREVVLSLGAIHTPKLLMQSGIGDEEELRRLGITPLHHSPGVGRNFQDHVMVAGCIWEYVTPLPPRNNAGESTFFWKSDPSLDTPDLGPVQVEVPHVSEATAKLNPPAHCWSIAPTLIRPRSRGQIRLTGPDPLDPVEIDANTLADPADRKAVMTCIDLCREIGNSAELRPFAKREVMPGPLRGPALEDFMRNAVISYSHETCTAKMGRDATSVVDGELRVYGIDKLRIADGSIMPRVTTGATMAPCVIIGERAGEFLKRAHRL